jgi:hypothetical protein
MTDKLQQVIALIKSGDKQGGEQLLAGNLAVEPLKMALQDLNEDIRQRAKAILQYVPLK